MSQQNPSFDVIIIGGSYSGLSAAMALGRSLRKVLIIDSGHPCNSQTPHSHNFLTQDGQTPKAIAGKAREQVLTYPTVTFLSGLAVSGTASPAGFTITTDHGDAFIGRKLIFAAGIKDLLPPIPGFSDCWGISVLHCPYCHGYEVKHKKTGVIANGDIGYDYVRMISNWTKDLTLFTNGKSAITGAQTSSLQRHGINVVEAPVQSLQHDHGHISAIVLENQPAFPVEAVYYKPGFRQNSDIPMALGCALTEAGHLQIDMFQKTNIPGIFACGDSTIPFRSVSQAVASGNVAGAMVNKELIDEDFEMSPA